MSRINELNAAIAAADRLIESPLSPEQKELAQKGKEIAEKELQALLAASAPGEKKKAAATAQTVASNSRPDKENHKPHQSGNKGAVSLSVNVSLAANTDRHITVTYTGRDGQQVEECLLPGILMLKFKRNFVQISNLKKKSPPQSHQFVPAVAYLAGLDKANQKPITLADVGYKGKKKKAVFDLLRNQVNTL
jgi:hypothetical protein